MAGFIRHSRLGGALAALTIIGVLASAFPANAAVVCKRVGYPKGCVAAAPVVVAPVAHRPVVYCKRVGYPKGCVMR
jgi:hypothetical protein